jgi:hypothetical protein
VDDPASTEVGVILLGLDTEHLLAGLAVASLADDPAAVTLLVDQARHDGAANLPVGILVAAGIRRWLAVRVPLIAAASGYDQAASLRRAWTRAHRVLARGDIGEIGPATAVYLTACLLRRAEMDRYCETWL